METTDEGETRNLILSDFKSLFTGKQQTYGQHVYKILGDGAKEKGDNFTINNKMITVENYRDHLNGKTGLGVVPINESNKVKFSVIDVDIYDEDLTLYIRAIERNNFPIVPFWTKSGGLHLYTFYRDFIPAKDGIAYSVKLAAALGLDQLAKKKTNRLLEIFPKQSKLQAGADGNWINMPYFNARRTTQSAVYQGQNLSISDAIVHIKSKVVSADDVEAFLRELPYSDAPPCLQTLYIVNPLGEGSGRNNYLFGFGAYLKKKDENFFEQKLNEVNRAMLKPIPVEELEKTVLQSLRKKEYGYNCTAAPLCDHCNKVACKQREYGVGKDDGYFSTVDFGKLTQIQTAQPYYELEVKQQEDEAFTKLRFKNEDEIIKQDVFLKLCFRYLHVLPTKLKQTQWFKIVNQCLSELELVQVDRAFDTSPEVLFSNLFLEFLLDRAPAQTKEQILSKRVWYEAALDMYMFRTPDLLEFLFVQKNFRHFNVTEVHGILKDFHCVQGRVRTESGKQLRVYTVPKRALDEIREYEPEEFTPNFELDDEDLTLLPAQDEKESPYDD